MTGAGPIGLLAALLGVQLGLDVHVLDGVSTVSKQRLVADLADRMTSKSWNAAVDNPEPIWLCVLNHPLLGRSGICCRTRFVLK